MDTNTKKLAHAGGERGARVAIFVPEDTPFKIIPEHYFE